MAVAPSSTSIFAQLKHGLRDLLAEVPAWQARVRVDSAAEAKGHIFLAAFDPSESGSPNCPWPFAIVSTPAGTRSRQVSGGGKIYLWPDHVVWLDLFHQSGYADLNDDATDFDNLLGDVWAGLDELSGVDDRLRVADINLIEEPARTHPDLEGSLGAWWHARLAVEVD